jgi:integrase
MYRVFDGRGLVLEVFPSGRKFWRCRYKKFSRSVGGYPEVGLATARAKAVEMCELFKAGLDPAPAAPPEPKKPQTFGELTEEWKAAVFVNLATATIRRKNFVLDGHILPILANIPVKEIKRSWLVQYLFRPIEARKLYETAARVKGILSEIFRWGGQVDDDLHDVTAGIVLHKVERSSHAGIVDPAKFGELLRAIHGYQGSLVVRIYLALLALTTVRPGELRASQWIEFDFEQAVWSIPAGRMKKRRLHVVPLSQQAVALLKELQSFTGAESFIFPNFRHRDRPLSDMAAGAALRGMGYLPDVHVCHGFRVTFSTLANEVLEAPRPVIEACLAHEVTGVEGIYNRSTFLEQRRTLMGRWADYLDELRAGG